MGVHISSYSAGHNNESMFFLHPRDHPGERGGFVKKKEEEKYSLGWRSKLDPQRESMEGLGGKRERSGDGILGVEKVSKDSNVHIVRKNTNYPTRQGTPGHVEEMGMQGTA